LLAVRIRRSPALRLQAGGQVIPRTGETNKCRGRRGPPASPHSTPQFTLNVRSQGSHYSLIAEGLTHGRPCQVTIDTVASVTIDGPIWSQGSPRESQAGPTFADGLWGDHPSAERGPRRSDPGTAVPEDFDVRR
jgi:hypothetical protein